MFFLGTGLVIGAAVIAAVLVSAECSASYVIIPIVMVVGGFALQIGGVLIERSKMKFLIKMVRLQVELNMRMLEALSGEKKSEKSEE